jgi:hypothetical protein
MMQIMEDPAVTISQYDVHCPKGVVEMGSYITCLQDYLPHYMITSPIGVIKIILNGSSYV